MKVTVRNIARFWKRLMFPPDSEQYRYNRMVLKYDMPWEPWLHAGVWVGMLLILVFGEKGIVPPIDGIDWIWLAFGLVSPTVGFFSVWALEFCKGANRYYALWGRMLADAGLVACLGIYQIARYQQFNEFSVIGFGHSVIPNLILFLCMWFTLTLVWRDVRFIIATEELATEIHKSVRELQFDEWLTERGDDGVR